MSRPIHATIDLAALRHNLGIARQYANGAAIWAVLKANAYGHGLLRCARALATASPAVDGFALIELESALTLRAAGLQQPILMLEGFYTADELPLLAEHRLIPTLHTLEQVRTLAHTRLPGKQPVYLKLNTGMNRLGLNAEELPHALRWLADAEHIGNITLMTHFAEADSPPEASSMALQIQRLAGMIASVQQPDRPAWPLCLANSAALLQYPATIDGPQAMPGSGWVRPGIMLYGGSPFAEPQSAKTLGLQPVMTLHSELITVRDIARGERVGYGGAFIAPQNMRIGVVACGYADGYPRHAPTGTPVLVAGQRTGLLGRVSMDKLCVDLGPVPQATVGSPVTLWGHGLAVEEVAQAAGTLNYELFCALAARVPVIETD